MVHILKCRRTFIAVLAIVCLTAICFIKSIDTSLSIASVAVGLAAANSYQGKGDGTNK